MSAGLGIPASDLPRLWSGRLGEHAGARSGWRYVMQEPRFCGCFPPTLNLV